MKKQYQKSWEKAFVNIHLQTPKHYLVLGLFPFIIFQGCGGDDPIPTPTPEGKDHPTEFIMKTTGLPKGVKIDTNNRTITVPPSMSNNDIISLFEQGKVSDKDGDAGIKTVRIANNKVIITIQWKNGKTNTIDSKTIEWTLIVSDIVADFPDTLSTTPITAWDKEFIPQLFEKDFQLNNGEKVKPSKILINGKEVNTQHIINTPWTYSVKIILQHNSKEFSKEYTNFEIKAKEIPTNDISKYTTQYRQTFNSIDPRRQDRGQIEWVAERMKLWSFLEITNRVLKPSGKTVAFFNQKEWDRNWGPANHHIEKTSKEIFWDNNEIKYIDVSPIKNSNDPLFKSKLEQTIRNHNFVITENNGGNMQNLRNITNNTNHGYVFSDEFWPNGTSPELLSNEGKGIVNFPTILIDNQLYTDPNQGYPNPQDNPLTNNIDSPILGGLNLGGTSYATESNAAIGAVLVNYCQRMGIAIDKSKLNSLLKNHPERLQPVYYSYYPEGVQAIWKNIKTTNQTVAHILDLEKFITHMGTFDLNPELKQLSSTNPRVPLFRHYDKLNYEYIKIGEEKGIIRENSIPYIDFTLLEQQGLTVNDLVYNISIADPSATDTYLWEGKNLTVK